jgi:hypothetical protein
VILDGTPAGLSAVRPVLAGIRRLSSDLRQAGLRNAIQGRREREVSLVSDLRYLRRSMARSPGPAVAVRACTAIWVAMAPAILSLLGALEWRSLPFPRSDRIVHVDAGLDLVPALADTDAFQAVASYDSPGLGGIPRPCCPWCP